MISDCTSLMKQKLVLMRFENSDQANVNIGVIYMPLKTKVRLVISFVQQHVRFIAITKNSVFVR